MQEHYVGQIVIKLLALVCANRYRPPVPTLQTKPKFKDFLLLEYEMN